MKDHAAREKMGLILVIALIVAALTWIASYSIGHRIGADVATLVGVVVTGLVSFAKDLVSALRGLSMSAQLTKVTDQLAASSPAALKSNDDAPIGTEDDLANGKDVQQ